MITRRLVLASAACSGLVSALGLAAKPRAYTVEMHSKFKPLFHDVITRSIEGLLLGSAQAGSYDRF
jgi:hypothetical protein